MDYAREGADVLDTVPVVQLSPALAATGTYPFVKLEEAKRRLAAEGVELIDFGKGDPREPTDPMIRRALAESLTEISTYPLAEGLPELRSAIVDWCARRFGVRLDPDTEVVPTYGSKEAIFLLAQVVLDRDGDKRLVVTTQPGYPVPDRGATFAGGDVEQLPLHESNGFLPELEAVPGTIPPVPSRRWTSCGARPSFRMSTTSCWRATRPTRSCGSIRRRTRRSKSATTGTSSRSIRSASAPR